jgi:hypothetical protein
VSQIEDPQQSWPAAGELRALGRVIQAASTFEHELGQAFCALIGSKYAAVLIGGKTSGQLIEDCRALTKAQRELTEPAKATIIAALNRCSEANAKRNRLVHDMWAFGPGGVSHQLRREKSGYDLVSRAVTLEEISAIANDLTSSAVELNSVLTDNLGPQRSTLEAQLRWEDAVAQMTPEERTNLMQRRLAGMLGEMSRLLARYNQESWAKWAEETAEVIKSNPDQGLTIISHTYSQEDVSSLVLSGEPKDPGPSWLGNQDPNVQLATVRIQIGQLASYLLSLSMASEANAPDK